MSGTQKKEAISPDQIKRELDRIDVMMEAKRLERILQLDCIKKCCALDLQTFADSEKRCLRECVFRNTKFLQVTKKHFAETSGLSYRASR